MRRISPVLGWRVGGLATAGALTALLLSACDRDPGAPTATFPTMTVVSDSVIGRQEAIRVFFAGDSLSAATALDDANFVVINQCTGLRVPGALRIGRGPGGDTLVFTPTQALPYLTSVGVRIQNLLTPSGAALRQPLTFAVRTENPPINDLTWHFLQSPTNDLVTGIGFADRTTGYVVTDGGSVYRSTDGGATFIPRYKDLATTSLANVWAFGDTVYTVGARNIGSVTHFGLLRSTDAALTFDLTNETTPLLYRLSMRRAADGSVAGIAGGLFDKSYVYRYDATAGTLTQATGIPGGNYLTTGVDISPTTAQNAVATFLGFPFTPEENTGLAVRSTDGGHSFTNVALPSGTFGLLGTGFIDDHRALLLGDSSVVLQLDVTTGAVTKLGEAEGIPQTARSGPGEFTAFSFSKASFAPGGQVGFIVGTVTTRRPNLPDVVNGIILLSRDGGAHWVRQGVASAPDNGQGFSQILDVQALAADFSVLSGAQGLIAARTTNSDAPVAVCSLTQQP